MCIEFAWKKAGIPIIRNFMHGCEGVLGGIPQQSRNRFFINYKVKSYVNGKSVPAKLIKVDNIVDAFPAKGDNK